MTKSVLICMSGAHYSETQEGPYHHSPTTPDPTTVPQSHPVLSKSDGGAPVLSGFETHAGRQHQHCAIPTELGITTTTNNNITNHTNNNKKSTLTM